MLIFIVPSLIFLFFNKNTQPMPSTFLIYGANGYVGEEAARIAVQKGLRPILAGRDANAIQSLATELSLEARIFSLDNPAAVDAGLKDTTVVLHCAGPYKFTSQPMVQACLRNGVHYLDLTGEIPVYQAVAALDVEAKAKGVMFMPGVGFDVVPTDCLAVFLQQQLPTATQLTLAFKGDGSAGLPPGTQRTAIELIPLGNFVRRNGELVHPERGVKTRLIDFGKGAETAIRLTWGDVFTAFYSTGIPNIENYAVMPKAVMKQLAALEYLRPLFRFGFVRRWMQGQVRPGPTRAQREQTTTHVWGEVRDAQGNTVAARLHGPEAGVVWTVEAALLAVGRVLEGDAPAGFQTPGRAYGADFVLGCAGVKRELC
jgi:short subunit dehydrogenase-like uncharacterized protein